jgi:hypothetical protein
VRSGKIRVLKEWREIEIEGHPCSVREALYEGSDHPYLFNFVDHFGTGPSYVALLHKMDGIDAWCRSAFGPPAEVEDRRRMLADGAWWRTETTFRLKNKSDAAAFKLFWT